MTGTLRERPFAEVVGSIFQGKQTGELKVSATGKSIAIHFQDGNPVAAASDDPSHRIARILLDNGKIGLGEAEMLGGLPESKQAFETVEYIPPDILLWGVKFRFLRLLEELFSWEDGEYGFTEGQVPPEALTLRVPTPFIIFTGTTKMPSAAFGGIGDEKNISEVREIPGEQDAFFNPQRKKFLAACKPGMNVGDLLAGMPGDRERARHTLYAFMALGLITLADPVAAEIPEPPPPLFGDEVDLEPEAEEPPALPFEPEPIDAPAAEGPPSLFGDEGERAAEPAAPPSDGGEQELPPESPPGEEQTEMHLEADDEEPPAMDGGPELSLEEAAPELPLEMPPAGGGEEEMVLGEDPLPPLEEEAKSAADSGIFRPPPDEISLDVTDIDDGLPLSRSMGLSAEEEETGILPEEPPEEPEERKKGRRLVPASRAGKIAALGTVLLLVIGGSLLGLKTLEKEPVPPPETATTDIPVPPEETPVPEAAPPEGTDPAGEEAVVVEPPAAVMAEAVQPEAPGSGTMSMEPPESTTPEPPAAGMAGAGGDTGAEAPGDEALAEETAQAATPFVSGDVPPLPPPAGLSGSDPLEVLRAGDVDGAARLWAGTLRNKPQDSYTIQVLMACEAKSVQESYALFRSHGEAFAVPFSLKGRDCYRVGLGTYGTIAAAKAALAEVPPEIRRSGAVVKSLEQFLPKSLSSPVPVTTQSGPAPAPAAPAAEAPKVEAPQMSSGDYGAAMDLFQAGDLDGAARLWRDMLRQSAPGSYTLQILTACDGDTVRNYFAIFEEHGRVFAVPLRLQGRGCYRVGLETYSSKKAAEAALAAMPAWVRDQRTVVKNVRLFVR